jgi:hypothetical protein
MMFYSCRVLLCFALTILIPVSFSISGVRAESTDDQSQITSENTYYVAKNGSNKNSGSLSKPWLTLAYAVDKLNPGDTLYVRSGVYSEKIMIENSGTASAPITISSYPKETAVLDGTGLGMSESMDAMVFIYDQSYIHIKGLEIRNYSTTETGTCIGGILVEGNCNGIELRNNNIHHIQNLANVDSEGNGRDAHGIAVYGSSLSTIRGLKITGNTISDCKLGSSEALAVNGNVSWFYVSKNLVYNNDNIGIAFIGYEGVCSSPLLDRARNGTCVNNIVHHIDSYGNPAYGTDQSADGIYCDGASKITIKDNIVHHVNFGIELASEHAGRNGTYNTVENNFVYNCTNAGLSIGGYDSERGSAFSNTIRNNTFYHNDTSEGGFGEIYLQYRAYNNVITYNAIIAGDQGILVNDTYSTNYGNKFNFNVYYSTVGVSQGIWIWKTKEYVGFESYRKGTSNDANSYFRFPQIQTSCGKVTPITISPDKSLAAGRQ